MSLAAFAGALYLLHRLVELELGREIALSTLLLISFFPASLFFGIPYTESLFLLLSVGSFYAARLGRWAVAALLAAVASATHYPGVLLVVPLALLYLYGPRQDCAPDRERAGLRPRYRLRASAGWLALVPLGLAGYAIYLELTFGDALAFARVRPLYGHASGAPLLAIWEGTRAAIGDIGQLADGLSGRPIGTDEGDWWVDSLNFAFMAFAIVATIGSLRRLPPAYGAYALVALGVPLSSPNDVHPLASIGRYTVVVFPLFIWLGLVCHERGLTRRALLASALGLAVLSWLWAAGHGVG